MCQFLGQGKTELLCGLAFSRRGEEEENDGNGYGDGEIAVVVDAAENTLKKIEKKKRSTEEIEGGYGQLQFQFQLQDPLSLLGYDIMHMIISFLDARSVALCLPVCRGWHGVACSDRLWSSKV